MNDDLLDALVFLKHNDTTKSRKRPTKSQEKLQTSLANSDSVIRFTPPPVTARISQGSGSPKTPELRNSKFQTTPRSKATPWINRASGTPETPKSSRNDPNDTVSADPVIIKRGRAEIDSKSSRKSRKTESTTIVENDETLDIDLNETMIQFDSNLKKFGSKATRNNQGSGSPKTPELRNSKFQTTSHVIRCTPGTSRFQNSRKNPNQSRGSMFQSPQKSNSVFRFRSSTDANQSISADPAVKKRGPAHDSDENFFDDSNNY